MSILYKLYFKKKQQQISSTIDLILDDISHIQCFEFIIEMNDEPKADTFNICCKILEHNQPAKYLAQATRYTHLTPIRAVLWLGPS